MSNNALDTQAILKIITDHISDVLPELRGREIGPNDRLTELGANSIDRAEIVALTLSSLSLRIPLVSTLEARNIGELAELLHARL